MLSGIDTSYSQRREASCVKFGELERRAHLLPSCPAKFSRRRPAPSPPRLASLHLTFLYVRNGTLEVLLRRDLADDHQQVKFAVVEVLRGPRGGRRRGDVRLAAQGLHLCGFHQGSHPLSSPLPRLVCPSVRPPHSCIPELGCLLPFVRRKSTGVLSRHASGAWIGVAPAFYTSRHCVIFGYRVERRVGGRRESVCVFFLFFFSHTHSTADVIRNESKRLRKSPTFDALCCKVPISAGG